MRNKVTMLGFLYIFLTGIFLNSYALDKNIQLSENKTFIWVIENIEKGEIIKLTGDGKTELVRRGGFKYPHDLSIDYRDGSIWVIDTGNSQVVKLSNDGKTELLRLSGFKEPFHGAIDQGDGSFWVADESNFEVVKISSEGKEKLRITGFILPHEIRISPYDGSVWVLDAMGGKVIKLSSEGEILGQVEGLGFLKHFAISPLDGSCWVAQIEHVDKESVNALIKISADCKSILAKSNNFGKPFRLSVNPVDGSCWVMDSDKGNLYNIAQDCQTQLFKLNFPIPLGLENISDIDKTDGSFWICDSGSHEIIKLSAIGKELTKVSGFNTPLDIVVYCPKE